MLFLYLYKKVMKDVINKSSVQNKLEDALALATTGAAAGIAVTKLTGHSKSMGALTGIGLSLLFFTILKMAK